MASERRLEKLNILIREELARILEREIEFPEGTTMVTITRVVISSDLHYGAAFISVLGEKVNRALEIISQNIYHIQQQLNKKLRIRPVPKIHFEIDREEIKREGVESSLAELKSKGDL